MNNAPVSATVYIWYPWGGNFGHASMYIGDPNIGRWVEYACDRFSISGRRSVYNSSYISWWPSVTAGVFDKAEHQTALFLKEDVVAECARPHVVYTLHGLNEQGMRTAWLNIRDKPNAHYQLLRKSCATVVLSVLKAGGALEKLSLAKRGWFSNNLYLSPKNVAQVCNELRDAGFATKVKSMRCPEKGAFNFGLR
jgi:hypothetical protein